MIRCSHCGKLAPAGALSCQSCGMPLANSGGMASAGQSEQQELPAWLESLRAHERPLASGAGERQPFSMDELVDENSMPHWMRQNQPRTSEGGSSDAFPVLSTTAQPGAGQGPAFPASGLAAGSLIEEKSLPEWMRNAQEGDQPGSGQNVSAQSLVDQQALPPWIKELSQTGPTQVPGWSAPAPTRVKEETYGLLPQTPVTPRVSPDISSVPQTPALSTYQEPPTQGFSAHDLVDQTGLPPWMTGAPGTGQQSQGRPIPTETGFAAGELIDQRSLPRWMQDQQGREKSGPLPAMGMPVNGSGQAMGMGPGAAGAEGMPASSLLDASALPSWMREENPGGAPGAQQPGGAGMAAGSLIDMGALPQWMRNEGNAQPRPSGDLRSPGPQNAGAARNEGMRVPSRPRNEISQQDQSEAAASVFSSMLGVSASAPVIPGQMPMSAPASNLGVAQNQAVPPVPPTPPLSPPPVLSGWQSPPQPAVPQPQGWQPSGSMSQAGIAPTPNAYMPAGQSTSLGGMQPQMQRNEQPAYPGSGLSAGWAGTGAANGIGGNRGGSQTTDVKKKGFFDAIRDFFFK